MNVIRNHNNNEENNILGSDNIEYLLRITCDADIPLDYDGGVSSSWRHINYDELFSCLVNEVPATNAGELAYIADKETQHGGTFGNIKISRHVLLNQCGELLIIKKYWIKGIILHKFFLQSTYVTIIVI